MIVKVFLNIYFAGEVIEMDKTARIVPKTQDCIESARSLIREIEGSPSSSSVGAVTLQPTSTNQESMPERSINQKSKSAKSSK